MSKSLSGAGSVDLTVNSLTFVNVTATNLTASSTTTTTDLAVSNNATITSNLALGSISDVEQAILDNQNRELQAGVGLTEDASTDPDTINFTGGDIGSVSINSTGTFKANTLEYLESGSTYKNVKTEIDSKQDTIPLITSNTASDLTLSRSNNDTSVLNVDGRINLTLPSSGILSTTPLFDCDVPADFLSIITTQFSCEGTASTANVGINDSNTTTPVNHAFLITQDANASYGMNLELKADGDIDLKNMTNKNITLSTTNTTKKHIVCDGVNFDTELYYDNALKLATTNTGVSVTGVIGATGEVSCVDIANSGAYNQSGTDANVFFGDTTFVGNLQYRNTPSNPASDLKNVKTEIDDLNTALGTKQDILTSGTDITIDNISCNNIGIGQAVSATDELIINTSGLDYAFNEFNLFLFNKPSTTVDTLEKRRIVAENTHASDSALVLFKLISNLGTGNSRSIDFFVNNFTRFASSAPSGEGFRVENTSYNGCRWNSNAPSLGSNGYATKLQCYNTSGMNPTNSGLFEFMYDGDFEISGTLTESSDINLKENITDANTDNVIEEFSNIRFVNYNYIDDATKTKKLGIIAQEIQEIYPNAVKERQKITDEYLEAKEEDDTVEPETYLSMKYEVLYLKSCVVVQELIKKIDELEQRISVLEN